jgi:PPOX class probable F420-dependent enzyme
LTEQQRKFLAETHYGVVTTLRADGSPHSTVVWVDVDDDGVWFNTMSGRVKSDNMDRDARVALLVLDENDAHRWIAVDGPVEIVPDPTVADADRLGYKYDGKPFGGIRENRITVRIRPAHVTAVGLD